MAFIFLFTSQFTILNNHLCALDTTLRKLITWYKLHVMIYISFGFFLSLWWCSIHHSILELSCLSCIPPCCWRWPFNGIKYSYSNSNKSSTFLNHSRSIHNNCNAVSYKHTSSGILTTNRRTTLYNWMQENSMADENIYFFHWKILALARTWTRTTQVPNQYATNWAILAWCQKTNCFGFLVTVDWHV